MLGVALGRKRSKENSRAFPPHWIIAKESGHRIRRSKMICCPNCDSARIHPSRRKGFLEKGLLAMIFVRPFRCEKCDDRFFRWSFSTNPNASPGTREPAR